MAETRLAAFRLTTIQAARAVAACLVILFHCSLSIFSKPRYWPTDPLHHLFAWGHQGVELFFVISGFIILQAHWHDVGRPARVLAYARKRIVRIYPVYWIVIAALVPVYALVPPFGGGHVLAPATLVSSVLLVHLGTRAVVLAVSWTLFYEVLFYALFAVLVADRRAGVAVLLVWWLLGVLRVAGLVPVLDGVFAVAPFSLLFGFGMAVALLYRRGPIPWPRTLAAVGTALFVANGLASVFAPILTRPEDTLVAGLAASVALAGFLSLERAGRITVARPLQLTGDASYGIYLVHLPVLSVLAKVALRPALAIAPPAVVEIALVAAAVAAGILFHLAVERPVLAAFRPRGHAGPAGAFPVGTGGGVAVGGESRATVRQPTSANAAVPADPRRSPTPYRRPVA